MSAEHREGDDGVTDALMKVTVTLYSISSKDSNNSLELGPVPSAEVKIEGETVKASCSGHGITGHYCVVGISARGSGQVGVLAKTKLPSQSPEEWRQEIEKRLEPTQMALWTRWPYRIRVDNSLC